MSCLSASCPLQRLREREPRRLEVRTDKPITKFARILETYFGVAPLGLRSFMMAMPLWLKQKLWIPYQIETSLEKCGIDIPEKGKSEIKPEEKADSKKKK